MRIDSKPKALLGICAILISLIILGLLDYLITEHRNYESTQEIHENVVVKKVNIVSFSDLRVQEIVSKMDLKSGIYSINKENTTYFYFNGIKDTYSNYDFKIEKSHLIISFNESENTSSYANKTVFEINAKGEAFDTIILLGNGENRSFKSCISYGPINVPLTLMGY